MVAIKAIKVFKTKSMKTNIILLVLAIITLFSCENPPQDEVVKPHFLEGRYQTVFMTSDIPLDINQDGDYSTNFMEQVGEVSFFDTYLRCVVYATSNEELVIGYPVPISQELVAANLNYTALATKIASVMIKRNDFSISHAQITENRFRPSNTQATHVEVIDENNFIITVFHDQIYDENLDKWMEFNLTCHYEKTGPR